MKYIQFKKLIGWQIGGMRNSNKILLGTILGLIGGLIYNFDLNNYSLLIFGNILFPIFLWILFGITLLFYLTSSKKKIIFSSLLVSLFSLVIVFNFLTIKSDTNIIKTTLETVIFFPFGYVLNSFVPLLGIIFIFFEWFLIGTLIGYVNKRGHK